MSDKIKINPYLSLTILIFCLFAIWVVPSIGGNGACEKANQIYLSEINHLITKKSIDYDNRNIGTIEFSQEFTNRTNSIVFYPKGDEYELYKYAVVGDTITKEKNSLIFVVRKESEDDKSFKIDFSCDKY